MLLRTIFTFATVIAASAFFRQKAMIDDSSSAQEKMDETWTNVRLFINIFMSILFLR